MNISIVIPVYNEAGRLDACLRAIAAQKVKPLEALVVDNNSTDNSSEVARRYKFVTLLNESKQGVVHARNRGFNAARGDIIGRIDADTVIPADWTARLFEIFKDADLAASSGSVYYYDVIVKPAVSRRLDLFFRQRLANKLGDEVFLFGSNMAIRRTAWQQTRPDVCDIGGIHEDFDLAIHLQMAGLKVTFDRHLTAGISIRRFNTSYADVWQYMKLSPLTYALHGRRSQRHMYPVMAVVLASLWFFWLNHRAYKMATGQLSWRQLLNTEKRVNPATFVD